MANDDLSYLSGLSEHPNRSGDVSNFNPAFSSRLAAALRQANAQGLKLGVMSGYRDDSTTGSAYDAGGNSSHGYGLASDISGLDGPNGKITNAWAQIASANGLHNPYGVDNKAEFNHWQLPEQPLEQTPKLLASLKDARASGNFQNVWSAYNSGGGPSRPMTPTPGPVGFAGLNPDARGMRNNNPGNLVSNDWTSKLPGYKGSDGRFAIFDTPEHGAAALDQNLSGYGSKGINTPLGIASTWAPASDNNNPTSYGAQIAKALGVGPNDKIDMSDPAIRTKVAQAIGMVENGPGNSAGFRTAYTGPSTPTAAVPGTTLAGITPDQSKALMANLTSMDKAMGGKGIGGSSGGGDEPQPAQMGPAPPIRNMSNPAAFAPAVWGNTLNSMQTPAQWSAQAPGQNPYAAAGGQPIGQQFGMQLGSMQQLQQMMAMMGNPYGDAGYG